jgi:energy-coupling factor transporter ATP-binding protein EcfA2
MVSDAMQQPDLLTLVQPAEGWFAITGIKGTGKNADVRQELVATREEADALIEQYVEAGRNAFFGVAKYKTGDNRKKENVLALKAFWLDVDCGPTKAEIDPTTKRPDGYVDQRTALQALRKFCKTVGLPTPTLVNSGGGIHAYWPLEEAVSRRDWEPVAERFKEVCRAQNFYVDDKVFEVARILRVPGTFNFKQEEPRPVQFLHMGDVTTIEEMRSIFGVKKQPTIFDDDFVMTPRQQALMGGVGYNFKRIMKRTAAGDGCNQLLHAYTNRASISYYEWFYALSVAAMCEDADKAVHMMSDGHPDYDPETVDKKVATIRKATSCAKFRSVNPELCEGCPHFNKILGPKELGKVVKESVEDAVEVETSPGVVEEITIPKYPFPFYRGENGGIWRKPPKDDAEAEPIMVYANDFYVVKRMHDPGEGDSALMRLHLPQDGLREFNIAMSKVTQKDELRKTLSANGVYSYGKKFDILMDFVMKSAENLQDKEKAEIMRQQFGWADNNSRFVLGDQEITVEGNIYSPPSKATSKLAKFIGPKGSLDQWKEVWALYGQEGMEAQAFAALSAFGSPLLKFLNQTGAVINLFNSRSGTGKTTILNMINSVYGHPKELRLKEIDTMNGKLQWVGVLNNIPATMDELTNASPKEYSDFLYSLSNGKGKERMLAGSNELRENNTTWQNITVSTSNSSFAEKLSILKDNPEGELMRLFEYPIGLVDAINTAHAKNLFDQVLFSNYGHAGPIYIRHVLANMEQVATKCLAMQAKIDKELQLLPKERFWSATVAANIQAGLLAKECNLIDWDMKRIYMWACDRVEKLRKETDAPLNGAEQVVGDYLYRYMQNILVVNDATDRRTNLPSAPIREPRGELLIRIEPDTKMMFILAKPFKEYCVKYQIGYNETLNKLEQEGRLVKRAGKRLSKGMAVSGDNVHCLWFKLDEDFVNVDDYAKPDETEDAD